MLTGVPLMICSSLTLRSLRVLACALLVTTLAEPGAEGWSSPQAPLSTQGGGAKARGIQAGDIRRGSLRLSHRDDGPTLRIENLEIIEERQPEIVPAGSRPVMRAGCLVLSELESSPRNRLGGRFRAVSGAPSLATADLHTDATGRRVLRVSLDRERSGRAG